MKMLEGAGHGLQHGLGRFRAALPVGLLLIMPLLLFNLPCGAASGVWTNRLGGSWTNAANWSPNVIASGAGNIADFSQLTLSGAPTVTLDGAQTIGNLIFGDQGNLYGWTLNTGSGGPLALAVSSGSPTITVNNQTASIGLVLDGANGMTKAGAGTLVLNNANTYTGGTTISNGTLLLMSPERANIF